MFDSHTTLRIPFETWAPKKQRMLVRYIQLREEDLHFVEGQEEVLIRRLQALLVMARRVVIDLLRSA